MTIDDRLNRAGQQFRDAHGEPAAVTVGSAPGSTRTRPPRRHRRTLGVVVAVCAVIALTVGVVAWVAKSGGTPRRTVTTPAGPTDPLAAFTTGTWQLTAVDTGSAPTVRPLYPYTLTVVPRQAGPTLHLDDNCNVATVPVDIAPGTIRVTGQALTSAVGCERPVDPAAAARAPVFGATTISWSISGGDLQLTAAGVTLTFTPVTPTAPTAIGGTRTLWQLVGALDGDTIVPVTATRSTELQFDATPGTVKVQDGCNSRSASYTLDGSTLVFSGVGTTDMACSDTAALQQVIDQIFTEGSVDARQATNRLTLTRGGVVLTYDLVGAG